MGLIFGLGILGWAGEFGYDMRRGLWLRVALRSWRVCQGWIASVAQWQSNGFVNRRSSVQSRPLAPSSNCLIPNGKPCKHRCLRNSSLATSIAVLGRQVHVYESETGKLWQIQNPPGPPSVSRLHRVKFAPQRGPGQPSPPPHPISSNAKSRPAQLFFHRVPGAPPCPALAQPGR